MNNLFNSLSTRFYLVLIISCGFVHFGNSQVRLNLPKPLRELAHHICLRSNDETPNLWICSSNSNSDSVFTASKDKDEGKVKMSVTESTRGKVRPGQLIFSEEFKKFNLDTWNHEITMAGGGNWEFQLYHNNRSNSFVKDGKLYLKPTLTADKYGEDFLSSGTLSLHGGANADQCTNFQFFGCERRGSENQYLPPVMSARIRTIKSFAFKYGKVEVRAKLPSGDWLWPTIWLLPLKNQYGNWPASGEIDIMESRGNKKLFNDQNINIGVEQISSTLNFGPYRDKNAWEKANFEFNSQSDEGFDKDFHIYELEWTPEFIKFRLDRAEIGSVVPPEGGFWEFGEFANETGVDNPWQTADNLKMAPFDQKFYILINLAVGGTTGYFPDNATGSTKPWSDQRSQAYKDFWNGREQWLPTWEGDNSSFIIDYVRVYAI